MAIPDEFKIILEDINEKFDILIEGHKGLNQKFDQLDRKIDREIEDRQAADMALLSQIGILKTDVGGLKDDVSVLKKDMIEVKQDVSVLKKDMAEVKHDLREMRSGLDEHRNNTELHGERKRKKIL
jgi:hypothetical protein